MSSVRTAAVTPAQRLLGHLRVPGDRSISHRSALMASVSRRRSELRNYAPGSDWRSTLICHGTVGAGVSVSGDTVTLMGRGLRSFRSPAGSVRGGQTGNRQSPTGPGDFPSAAVWMVAAEAIQGSVVTLEHVRLNPTCTALIDVLRNFGVLVDLRERANAVGKPIRTIILTGDRTGSIHIQPHDVPELIDELPAFATLAAQSGEVRVHAARALGVKESDGTSVLVAGRRAFGVEGDKLETLDRLVA